MSDLYISKISDEKTDKNIFDNIVIDKYSLELLKKGKKDQRYAVVGWLDEETQQLHLHFRPSFTEGEHNDNRNLFDKEDILEAPEGLSGVVHQRVIQSVRARAHRLDLNEPYLLTGKKIGLSFYKRTEHILEWTNRSTLNSEVFMVNPLAYYALYFDSNKSDFTRPKYTNALHIERSLETLTTWKIVENTDKTLLQDSKLSQEEKQLKEEISKKNENHFYNKRDKDIWDKIKDNKKELSNYLMRTIYIASGLEKATTKQPWPQPENWVVIKETLEVANKNEIKLNFDYIIPPNDKTALMHAARMGDIKSIRLLLEAKANINKLDKNKYTPIWYAAAAGQIDAVKMLLDAKADLSHHTDKPAWKAARMGQVNVIQMMLDAKVTLQKMINIGNTYIVQKLIKAKTNISNPDQNDHTPVYMAVQQGHADIVNILISAKADINKKCLDKDIYLGKDYIYEDNIYVTPLYKAINVGREDLVKILIDAKADVNKRIKPAGDTCILMAVKTGNIRLVKMLIEAKAQINKRIDGITPLGKAIRDGQTNIAEMLIEHKADVNMTSIYAPLCEAVRNGDIHSVKLLIDANVNVNKMGSRDKYTPLFNAVKAGREDLVSLLIGAKADIKKSGAPSAVSMEDYRIRFHTITALDNAVRQGHVGIVRMLIEAKAEVNTRNTSGNTPLYTAVHPDRASNADIVKLLLDAKANISPSGKDPLIVRAIKNEDVVAIKVLLEHKVDLHVRDAKGNLPLEYANQNIIDFIVLQMLKTYIETHPWKNEKNSPPAIAVEQLKLLNECKLTYQTNWTNILTKVISLAKTDKQISLFPTNKEWRYENAEYLALFSPSDLLNNITQAIAKDNLKKMKMER